MWERGARRGTCESHTFLITELLRDGSNVHLQVFGRVSVLPLAGAREARSVVRFFFFPEGGTPVLTHASPWSSG